MKLLFAILRLGIVAYIIYLFIGIILDITIHGWIVLLVVSIVLGLLSLLRVGYEQIKSRLVKNNCQRMIAVLDGVEQIVAFSLNMAVGAVLYCAWLKNPGEVYAVLFVLAWCVFFSTYDKYREQGAP